jgi:DNA-binding response OmpR family regulator
MATILIVEDDADLVETYTDLLAAKGYVTTSASTAADAVHLAISTQPSIVILDLSLPGSSGIGVLDFVRGYKLLENTKILVVTGHAEMTNSELIEKADVVLSKPVSNEQLLAMIARLLRLSEAINRSNSALCEGGDCGRP